jgi:molybdate-binding protein
VAITFAEWEEGLLAAHGNPKGIRGLADLARPDVRIVNREPGSGSRRLLDAQLESAGVPAQQVLGYADEATGHLAAAWRVHSGIADACVATRSAALAFGLTFLPLKAERFDLVLRRATRSQPAVSRLMDLLTRAEVRREMEAQAACDTSSTGQEVTDSRPARRRG